MIDVCFKELFIIDIKNKIANKTVFEEKINVITSKDNHVGKSTILKSLYYTLGAEVRFGDRLNIKELMHILKFSINDKDLYIIRKNNNYLLQDANSKIFISGATSLSKELAKLFNFEIFLEDTNKNFVQAPPVFYYLPYYIDQDEGWSPDPISFKNLTQFNKDKRKDAYYFHLGVLDEEYGKSKFSKKELESTKKLLEQKKINILSLLSMIEEHLTAFDNSDNLDELLLRKEEMLDKYKKYNYDSNNIKRKILEYREELIKIDSTFKNLDNTIKKQEKIKESINESFEVICPHCNEKYEVNNKKLLKINYDIQDITFNKISLLESKSKIQNQIEKEQQILKSFLEKIQEIEKQQIGINSSFEDILRFKGMQSNKKKLSSDLLDLEEKLSPIIRDLKEVNSKLKKWSTDLKIANELYFDTLREIFIDFNVTEVILSDENKSDINMGSVFTGSGSGQVRVNLAKIYSIIKLINSYNMGREYPLLPLIIDSPKSGEQSLSNNQLILDTIINKIDLKNQIIIATIDFYSFNDFLESDVNIIELDNPEFNLLDKKTYTDASQFIEKKINTFIMMQSLKK